VPPGGREIDSVRTTIRHGDTSVRAHAAGGGTNSPDQAGTVLRAVGLIKNCGPVIPQCRRLRPDLTMGSASAGMRAGSTTVPNLNPEP
jgi:hypothetical protein